MNNQTFKFADEQVEKVVKNFFHLKEISFAIKVASGPFLYASPSFSIMLKDYIKTTNIVGKNLDQVFLKNSIYAMTEESIFLDEKNRNYIDEVIFKKNKVLKTFFWLKFKINNLPNNGRTKGTWIGIVSLEAATRNIRRFNKDEASHSGDLNKLIKMIKKILLTHGEEINKQKTDLNNIIDTIETLSTRDFLTGLFNRKAFENTLNLEIKKALRHKYPLCLLVIDIDDFKLINDNYGHVSGDDILKELSSVLTDSLRETDYVCRWGGEEFAVILQDCNLDNAAKTSEKILNNVRKKKFNPKAITVSIGCAQLKTNENTTSWFIRADKALFKAKREGKNRVVVSKT